MFLHRPADRYSRPGLAVQRHRRGELLHLGHGAGHPVNPAARHTTALVQRVARELAAGGWKLQAVSTDNGSEFRAAPFTAAVRRVGAEHRFIRAGRPQTNGCVERVHRTILEECWRPTFARSLVPKFTALRRDLDSYLHYYNFERAHTGISPPPTSRSDFFVAPNPVAPWSRWLRSCHGGPARLEDQGR